MPITQLEHFLVLTDDIEVTRRFYCDALGLAVGPRPPLAFAGYWLYVGNTPCVHVAERASYERHSATVGIPRKSPDGYYEEVPNSVRISYGGAFVHAASWSVRDQGVRNVSHGCVNISPADAAWFFDVVKRGDVVDIKNAKAAPLTSDPGMSDWNIPFSAWAN